MLNTWNAEGFSQYKKTVQAASSAKAAAAHGAARRHLMPPERDAVCAMLRWRLANRLTKGLLNFFFTTGALRGCGSEEWSRFNKARTAFCLAWSLVCAINWAVCAAWGRAISQRVMFLPNAANDGLACREVSKNKIKRILAPGKLCTRLANNCSSCSGTAEALFSTQNWVAKIFLRLCMACASD